MRRHPHLRATTTAAAAVAALAFAAVAYASPYDQTHDISSYAPGSSISFTERMYDATNDQGSYVNGFPETQYWVYGNPNYRLELVFTDFATESCCDHVNVYDGNGMHMGSFSGSGPSYAIVSETSSLYLTFASDGSVNDRGWVARVTVSHTTVSGRLAHCGTSEATNAVRLADGSSRAEGRLEIYHDGQWGTVCNRNQFGNNAAETVCRELGCEGSSASIISPPQSATDGMPIWTAARCEEVEDSYGNCHYGDWGRTGCDHSSDVGIRCNSCSTCEDFVDAGASSSGQQSGECRDGQVRLVNGGEYSYGELQMWYDGQWGLVCNLRTSSYSGGTNEAQAVCRQLGCDYSTSYADTYYASSGTRVALSGVQCYGGETRLTECQSAAVGSGVCDVWNMARVQCGGCRGNNIAEPCTAPPVPEFELPECEEGSLRLYEPFVDGSTTTGGLQVYHDGDWFTICDDGFDSGSAAATVACRQMGCGAGVFESNWDTDEDLEIGLDDIYCSGSESRIIDCAHDDWEDHNCGHSEGECKPRGILCGLLLCWS